MNRELLTIIESLCHRIEYTGHSGLSFIESKPEMCRMITLRVIPKCEAIDCDNCYFTRRANLDNIYTLKLERLIQRI